MIPAKTLEYYEIESQMNPSVVVGYAGKTPVNLDKQRISFLYRDRTNWQRFQQFQSPSSSPDQKKLLTYQTPVNPTARSWSAKPSGSV